MIFNDSLEYMSLAAELIYDVDFLFKTVHNYEKQSSFNHVTHKFPLGHKEWQTRRSMADYGIKFIHTVIAYQKIINAPIFKGLYHLEPGCLWYYKAVDMSQYAIAKIDCLINGSWITHFSGQYWNDKNLKVTYSGKYKVFYKYLGV